MGSENNMVAVPPSEITFNPAYNVTYEGADPTRGYVYRLAQPDAQQGEATVADMAAFGASDVACYLYPGEHQQAERAAFCEGAARSATPQQGASSPASGEGVERVRRWNDAAGVYEYVGATPLAAATQPAVPQEVERLRAALEGVVAELSELYRAVADTKSDAQARIDTEPCLIAARAALTGAGENGEQDNV